MGLVLAFAIVMMVSGTPIDKSIYSEADVHAPKKRDAPETATTPTPSEATPNGLTTVNTTEASLHHDNPTSVADFGNTASTLTYNTGFFFTVLFYSFIIIFN